MYRPFNVAPDQLGRLTLRQVYAVYFHPRKDDGTLDRGGSSASANTYEDDFRGIWQARGASPSQVDRLWQHYLIHEASKTQTGMQLGILGAAGDVISHDRNAALEEQWAGIWRETAKGIMNHA